MAMTLSCSFLHFEFPTALKVTSNFYRLTSKYGAAKKTKKKVSTVDRNQKGGGRENRERKFLFSTGHGTSLRITIY